MSENRKNLAVIGCGPALGFHVAKRFAQEGYNVGMLSNMPEQLEEFAKEIADKYGADFDKPYWGANGE